MYRTIDHMLYDVFFSQQVIMGSKSNAQIIEEWLRNKGVVGRSFSELSQEEWIANGALIVKKISQVLTEEEYALLSAEYGYDYSNIVNLTKYITSIHHEIDSLVCDDILAYILTKKIKQTVLQDKFDWNKVKCHRRIKKINKILAEIHQKAFNKLYLVCDCYLSKDM